MPRKTADTFFSGISAERPWAPFLSLADFEYTETAVNGLLSKKTIDKQLSGFNSRWAIGSHLSIQNSKTWKLPLRWQCEYIVKVSVLIFATSIVMTPITLQFKSDTVSVEYQGVAHRFDFEYRDPWEWILALIHDKSTRPTLHVELSSEISLYWRERRADY